MAFVPLNPKVQVEKEAVLPLEVYLGRVVVQGFVNCIPTE
jgi:hypothetical protein